MKKLFKKTLALWNYRLKKIFQKFLLSWNLLSKKRKIFVGSSVFVVAILLVSPLFVNANVFYAGVANIVVALIGVLAALVGEIIKLELQLFVSFAQWTKFSKGVTAVDEGWKITRDICNMFFILVLLVIAFSTIINYEAYSYKKWLGKLIMTAVIINFSKTIVGLMIDFSQVVMLTFVNGFKDIASGNIIYGLHLDKVFNFDYAAVSKLEGDNEFNAALAAVTTAGLGLAMLVILSSILLMFVVILVWRIVYIWVLVVLSPMAFFLQGTPFGSKYSSRWWTEFGKQLTTGPVLAFFLYLSLLTIQRSQSPENPQSGSIVAGMTKGANTKGSEVIGASSIVTIDDMFDYVVVIALLITSMKIAQESGVAGGNIAGNMTKKMSGYVKRGVKSMQRGVTRRVGGSLKRGIVDPLNSAVSKTGVGQYIPGTYANQLRKERIDVDRKDRVKERKDAVQKHAVDGFNDSNFGKVWYGKTGASKAEREKNERTFGGWGKMYAAAVFGNKRKSVIDSRVTSIDKMTETSGKIDKRIELNDRVKRALDLGVVGTKVEETALVTDQVNKDLEIRDAQFEIQALTKKKGKAKTAADKQSIEKQIELKEADLQKFINESKQIKEKIELSKDMSTRGGTQTFIKDIIAAEKRSMADDLNSILEGIKSDRTISGSERKKKSQDAINTFAKREVELNDLDKKTTVTSSDLHDNKIYLSEQKEVFTKETDLQQQEVLQNNLLNKEESSKIVSDAENRKAEAKYANLGSLDKDQVPAISQALASGNIAEVNVVMQKAAKDYNLEAILEKFGYEKSSKGLMEFLRREMVVDRQLLKGSNKRIEEQLALMANNISKEAGQYNLKYDKMAVTGIDGKMRSNVGFEPGADIRSKSDMTVHWKDETQKKVIDIIYSGKETLELFRKMHVSSYTVGNNVSPDMIQQLVKHQRNLIDLINDGKTPFNPKILKVLMSDIFTKELSKQAPKLLDVINKRSKS